MNQFSLHKGKSNELLVFPHLIEFSKKKIQSVQPNSFVLKENTGFRFIYILEGKFDWQVDGQQLIAFPNDLVLVYPNQNFGSSKGSFDIGSFFSITVLPRFFNDDELILGDWSSISESEQRLIGKLLSLNKKTILPNFKAIGEIFQKTETELFSSELGFKTRINHLLDEMIIATVRQLSKQENLRRDFPQTFQKLDQILRENLAHAWNVEEMAAIMGLGTTAFTEKVKSFSGFSPLNYLINLRISEAIRLLKTSDMSLTNIALDTGFYSSQHFSTTFKKLTGYTPGHFRKQTKN